MMGATQPFLSGASQKPSTSRRTAPSTTSPRPTWKSWRQGLKAVAIYRDNSKGTQPLNVNAQTDADKKGTKVMAAVAPVAAGSIEIEEAVAAAKAATMASAQATIDAAHTRVTALETQLKAIAEAAMQNSDSVDARLRPALSVTVSPPSAPPSPTSSASPDTRATSPSASTPTASPAKSHPHGQGRLHRLRPHGLLRHCGLSRPPARRAAQGPLREVRPHPLRALRLDRQRADRLRQVDHGLHLPLDPDPLPLRHQLDLFSGLAPQTAIPVEGTVTSPSNTIVPSLTASSPSSPSVILSAARSADKPALSGVEGKDPEGLSPATSGLNLSASNSLDDYYPTTPPQQGIAPDLTARSGLTENGQLRTDNLSLEDRGIYHASDAMKSLYDMGDSPPAPPAEPS